MKDSSHCQCDVCVLGRKIIAVLEEHYPTREDGYREVDLRTIVVALSRVTGSTIVMAENEEDMQTLVDDALNAIDHVVNHGEPPEDNNGSVH